MPKHPDLKPCPFCGNTKLYSGHVAATAMGILCGCGVELQRCYPDTASPAILQEAKETKQDMLNVLDRHLLAEAITAWNTRIESHD